MTIDTSLIYKIRGRKAQLRGSSGCWDWFDPEFDWCSVNSNCRGNTKIISALNQGISMRLDWGTTYWCITVEEVCNFFTWWKCDSGWTEYHSSKLGTWGWIARQFNFWERNTERNRERKAVRSVFREVKDRNLESRLPQWNWRDVGGNQRNLCPQTLGAQRLESVLINQHS